MIQNIKNLIYEALIFRFGRLSRLGLSRNYIYGSGIEIGAMDYPLKVKKGTVVQYLDRIPREKQIQIFKDLNKEKLVKVDIVGNGETLDSVEDNSQNFIIANHFIEHCQNPILTIKNFIRVLKNDGVIFMAIPDKRYTFDNPRKITTLDHFANDYIDGAAKTEYEHYFDFVKHTSHGKNKSDNDIPDVIKSLKERNFSIHFHVWDHQSMIEFFCMLKNRFNFKFEILVTVAAQKYSNESIFILKKTE